VNGNAASHSGEACLARESDEAVMNASTTVALCLFVVQNLDLFDRQTDQLCTFRNEFDRELP
jgi:hypothetical protein